MLTNFSFWYHFPSFWRIFFSISYSAFYHCKVSSSFVFKYLYFPFLLKDIFCRIQNSRLTLFLQNFKNTIPPIFWVLLFLRRKFSVDSHFCFLFVIYVFFWCMHVFFWCFYDFCLRYWSLTVWWTLRCGFLCIYPVWGLLRVFGIWLYTFIKFGNFPDTGFFFFQFYHVQSFLSFWNSNYMFIEQMMLPHRSLTLRAPVAMFALSQVFLLQSLISVLWSLFSAFLTLDIVFFLPKNIIVWFFFLNFSFSLFSCFL